MTMNKRSRRFSLSLTWAACLCCVHVGCDGTSEPLAGEIDHDGELLHAEEVEARDTRESVRVAAPEHDDGCGQRSPVTVEWVVGARAISPRANAASDAANGSSHRADGSAIHARISATWPAKPGPAAS